METLRTTWIHSAKFPLEMRARRIARPGLGRAIALCTSSIAALAATQALAAPEPAQPSPAAGSPVQIEEVIVTAQKRSERLQDVPVAVTAIGPERAAAAGVASTSDLANAVPGLTFSRTANVGSPYLRGVGSNQVDPSSESSVAIYVDGVYIAAPQSNLFDLSNIQQIEVLKGPQGTLFGRNATGGVIQVTTMDPKHEPRAAASVTYANYDDIAASVYGTAGLGDKVAADLYASFENQGKGWGRNLTTGLETYKQAVDNWSLRSKWLFDFDPDTHLRLAADYTRAVSLIPYQKLQGTTSPIDGSTYPGRYDTRNDVVDYNRVTTGGASATLEHDLGWARFSSITAYRVTHVQLNFDNDITAVKALDIALPERARNYSEELQLTSPRASSIQWILGAFFFGGRGSFDPFRLNGVVALPFDQQKTTSQAAYAQATAPIGWATNATLGLRYTNEDQTYDFPAAGVSAKQNFGKLTYRLSLDHHFSRDLMGYISQNSGFKSGGFNLLAPGNRFKPETLDATEVGLKGVFLDRMLSLNTSAFYYNYKNMQLTLAQPQSSIITNAAQSHLTGGEIDAEFRPTPDLVLSASASAIHSRVVDYPGAVAVDMNGVTSPPMSFAGYRTAKTPAFSGTLSAQYTIETSVGRIIPTLSASYSDGFYWQPDNRLRQPRYTLLNGSVGWTPASGRFGVRLWMKNILDKQYYAQRVAIPSVGDAQLEAAPRTFGITVTMTP